MKPHGMRTERWMSLIVGSEELIGVSPLVGRVGSEPFFCYQTDTRTN